MSIANDFVDLKSPTATSLINNAAYVNYYIGSHDVSDSLYRKTITINKNFGLESASSSAVAINGLGLLMTANKEYEKADSLFIQALKLHRFSDNFCGSPKWLKLFA